jgi:exopolyphosphatase/guanosine-5'-triphosphate,3'-diphosphate pyrophosphatase
VLAGGLCILYTLASHFDIEALRPAKGALRQGVIFDLDERLSAARGAAPADADAPGDRRDASVAELQRRFEVDVPQARRVRAVALALYRSLQPDDDEGGRELGWAADLHEMGLMVSHHDHHRHSAYLLAHADAPAFSQTQQRRLSAIVLGQRGGLRKIESALVERRFALQVLALRLAVIKCHARESSRPARLRRAGRSCRWSAAPPGSVCRRARGAARPSRAGP